MFYLALSLLAEKDDSFDNGAMLMLSLQRLCFIFQSL